MVSGFAGVRPLVAEQGVTETKKLIRDDELEFDAKSGLISILGGKWTTHRLMGQETIDKVQEWIGEAVTPSPTPDHALSGAAHYQRDYWQTLADQFKISKRGQRNIWLTSTERWRRMFSVLRIPIRRSHSRWWKARRPFALRWFMRCARSWR